MLGERPKKVESNVALLKHIRMDMDLNSDDFLWQRKHEINVILDCTQLVCSPDTNSFSNPKMVMLSIPRQAYYHQCCHSSSSSYYYLFN